MSRAIESVGVPFAHELRRHGDRLGVVAPDGSELTYRELADRVRDVAERLGSERRLVHLTASNDVEPLVTYLAALQGGHPVLLASEDDTLISTYDPDVVLRRTGGEWKLQERRPESAHTLHPELAVLLSTSGSTGSPKLIRLSANNLQANAASIAEYLDIRDTDRAATSLPMHYCYGLSVINSNMLAGAALVLTGNSVVDRCFWDTFTRYEATSLHGVPYTFELLDTLGFDRMDLPSLRYVTQAGGRLDPDRVRRYAELADRAGWQFFVMYGQTEATARMAYLPPQLAASNPSAVGVPIPGGSFELAPDGELIYHGPNVMLGYADRPADLALGRTIDALATGDIARRTPTGLYEIVGRKNRFIKLFGLRIDLQQVERLLADGGFTTACAGTDDSLIIAVLGSRDVDRVRELVLARFGLPASSLRVVRLAEFPRLPTGKIDYPAIEQHGREAPRSAGRHGVRPAFARILKVSTIPDDASFVSLGGDSLTHVQMSIELEMTLGHLPPEWHTMPVRQLERLRPRQSAFRLVETDIVLRAIAITLIVGTHAGLFAILGGAHLLLVLAGWSFARFGLADERIDRVATRILGSATRIAVPAVLWLNFRAAASDDIGISNILLINNYVSHGSLGYWFIEVLVHTLVVLAIVFAIPAVARFERRHSFTAALVALLFAVALLVGIDSTGAFPAWGLSTHGVLWFFMLGWLVHRAVTGTQKCVVLAATFLLVPGFLGDPLREGIVIAGVLLMMMVTRTVVPKPLVRLLGRIAGASLYIYLTHYAVYPLLLGFLPPLPVVAISIAVGIVAWRLAEWCGTASTALKALRIPASVSGDVHRRSSTRSIRTSPAG